MPPKAVPKVEPMSRKVQKSGTSTIGSNLANFSNAELSVMSHILMAILHAKDFQELLQEMHLALNRLLQVNGCAIYRVSDKGRGLQLAYRVGECDNYLPDLIPQSSNLFTTIGRRQLIDISTSGYHQPSLFDDQPVCMFGPLVVDDNLLGCLSIIHLAPDAHFVSTILNEALIALELLCKADSFADSLSIRAHYGSASEPAAKEEADEMDDGYSKLTPREREVLSLLALGLSNKELANRLYISSATCKHHVENILTKLKVPNRAAAVAIALAHSKS